MASLLRLARLILSCWLTSGMASTTAPALAGRPGRVVTWIHRFLGLLNCVYGVPFLRPRWVCSVTLPHRCSVKPFSVEPWARPKLLCRKKLVMRLNGQFLFA